VAVSAPRGLAANAAQSIALAANSAALIGLAG
jgi:hypothetical protein